MLLKKTERYYDTGSPYGKPEEKMFFLFSRYPYSKKEGFDGIVAGPHLVGMGVEKGSQSGGDMID
jgi:hypothetical protein